jgi:hypothetical protein
MPLGSNPGVLPSRCGPFEEVREESPSRVREALGRPDASHQGTPPRYPNRKFDLWRAFPAWNGPQS